MTASGQVRQEAGDAIAGDDAELAQSRRDARDLRAQFAIGQAAPRAALVDEHERRMVVAAREQVLGEVEPRVLEPERARHALAVLQDRPRRPAAKITPANPASADQNCSR